MNILLLNAFDKIQKILVEEFTQTIPTKDIILSLTIAIIAAIIINFIYKKTYMGVSYTKSFALSIVLLTMVTSLVIRTINSNLSLSLGMVGALSIVRFRTAVKDPIDTIFMFWSITAGIMAGAGLYIVTLIATLIIGLLYLLSYSIQIKSKNKVLLVIKATTSHSDKIVDIMKTKKKCILKTESYKNSLAELTYEVANRNLVEDILAMKKDDGIISINLIEID